MPLGFFLACATCVLYDAWGLKYEERHNRGIGAVLFASICIMTAGFDVTGDQLITASLIAWPGFLWGLVLYVLLYTEDKAGCLWLIISPLMVLVLGLPVLSRLLPSRGPLRNLRIATGLSAIGILLGHFLSKSSLGRTIDDYTFELLRLLNLFPGFQPVTGAVIMFLSVAWMVQEHLETTEQLEAKGKVPNNAVIEINLPPLWGIQRPWCAITWTLGLVVAISAIDEAHARAGLVSTSVAVVLTMAFIHPFSDVMWGRTYKEWTRLLFVVHVALVLHFSLLYQALFARPDRDTTLQGTGRTVPS